MMVVDRLVSSSLTTTTNHIYHDDSRWKGTERMFRPSEGPNLVSALFFHVRGVGVTHGWTD